MTQVKTFNRRTFLKTGVIGAGAVALTMAACKPTDDEETDDPNNGNGGNPDPKIPTAAAIKDEFMAETKACIPGHKHATHEEAAACRVKSMERLNTGRQSKVSMNIIKTPNSDHVDLYNMSADIGSATCPNGVTTTKSELATGQTNSRLFIHEMSCK